MKKRVFPAVMAALALTSCEKELDFEYHSIGPITVIEGNLTAHGSSVILTLTTPMDRPMDSTPLTDATVTLTDLTAGTSLTLAPDRDGHYTDPTAGIEGHDYRLTVNRAGMSFTSDCAMGRAVQITGMTFSWIRMPYDHVAILQTAFTDPPAPGDYYWVRLYRNGAPYKWSAVSDYESRGGTMVNVVMTTRRDTSQEGEDDLLLDGDTVTASVTPISRAMYDYLTAIGADSSGPRMFDGDFCLGYFLAAPVATESVVFHPDDF